MKNNYYQLYIEKVLTLAATMVIKSTDAAAALNTFISTYHAEYPIDYVRPETWKYYRNLAGEYHVTDTLMQVVSMDTLEEIVFSKDNLSIHRATARGYAYGTRQYRELVAAYPEQEMLILGILYPVDIATAVAAADGAILGYPPGLVEDNEYNLIPKLQEWIYGYKIRWSNRQYAISDDLYAATSLGILYLNLVPTILNLRLEACKTNEAHSFHVRQYLSSHGILDQHIDFLTTKQALFLYRNIAYIERNAGKRETFDWLVEHIMTERGLPLAEYVMRHDLSQQPTQIYPSLKFRRNPLNLEYSAGVQEAITLPEMLDKQDALARDNALYKADYLPIVKSAMENARANVALTKVLESSLIDYSNSSPYNLDDILIHHWLYLAYTGHYTAFVNIANPKTGELLAFSAKDAFIFLWYAYCKTTGLTLTTIPRMVAQRVQRVAPAATVDDIWSMVDAKLIPKQLATQMLALQPKIGPIVSTEKFYDTCVAIYEAAQVQRRLVVSQEHRLGRGMAHNMMSRIYADCIVSLAEEDLTYTEWFAERNFNVAALSLEELGLMYKDILAEATGAVLHPVSSLKALQRAMVGLLTQLSSYSIQVVGEINDSNLKRTDMPIIRIGDRFTTLESHVYFPDGAAKVRDTASRLQHLVPFPIHISNAENVAHVEQRSAHDLEVGLDMEIEASLIMRPMRFNALPVRPRLGVALNSNAMGIVPVPGLEIYLGLSLEQQQGLRDIYHSDYSSLPPPTPTVLPTIVLDTNLDGLNLLPDEE